VTSRGFATHTRVAVIGAGAGGHSVTSQLVNSGKVAQQDITVFDSREQHHYQPAYTMVGGGVLGNASKTKTLEGKYVVRPQTEMFGKHSAVNWVRENVATFEPEQNTLKLADGSEHTYDILVIAPGCQLRFDLIEGSQEAIEDPNSPVSSIYTLNGAYKTSVLREGFRGGKAVFYMPPLPIKCGGGPQKIMYLSEETFRKNGVRDQSDVHYYSAMHNMFPNCLKFSDALVPIAAEKNIDVHFKHLLKSIDKDNRVATYENLDTEEKVEVDYDFLHIVPAQTAPDFIRSSSLAAANGWLDVDTATLQHNKFSNIFGLGDVSNLPTAKTAAGVFAQTPVVVNNILKELG